jgi:hypothetical protein
MSRRSAAEGDVQFLEAAANAEHRLADSSIASSGRRHFIARGINSPRRIDETP